MKTIVIYHSQTGFMKRYAQWIAEAVGAECAKFSAAKKKELGIYGAAAFFFSALKDMKNYFSQLY